MADVITRFKLETNQYDSKLRDASQELAKMSQHLQNAGKEFDRFAQKHVEAARALGQTESGATNLKDKLRDLVSAYNNVAKAYNNLSAEQQKTDFGKAMAASLDQLQQRITQTKQELYSMTDSTKQAEGGLGSLNNIFGMSISKLAGWGAAISTAKGALDVAKDAFFASEANIDEWGRTVEASGAIYEGFLTSINTGDISGYLSRISQISQAARDAYDALDLLGTQKTIQSPQLAKKQAEITRMRTILQTGKFIEAADGRTSSSGLKTGDKLSKAQLEAVAKQLESAMTEVANITKSQVKSATNAIDKMYEEQALILGVSKQKYMQVTGSWENFQYASSMADEYKKWRKENTTYTTLQTSGGPITQTYYDNSKNPYREWEWLSTFKDDGERFKQLVAEIQNREAAKSGLYSQYGQIYRRINKVEGYNPYGGGGDTNKEVEQAAKGIGILTKQLQELQKEQSQALNPEAWQEIQKEIERTQTHIEAFKGKWKDGMQATFSVSINDTEAYDKLKNLPNVLVDEDGIKVTADTAEAYLKCQKLFEDIENEKVEFKIIPKLNPDELFPDLDITEPSISIFDKVKSAAREKLAGEMLSVDEETFATILQDSVRYGIDSLDSVLQELQEKMAEGLDIPDEAWQKIIDQYNELRKKIGEDPIKIDLSTGKMATGKDKNNDLHSLISNVTTITRSLQDLGVEIPDGFSNVINIMNIIQTLISTISTMSSINSAGNVLSNIPIVGSVFGFFGSLFGFANGGIVPRAAGGAYIGGNHFSNDVTPVWANAGEVILNRAQQGVLAAGYDVANGTGTKSEAVIEGDTIRIVLQNTAQAKGMTLGQYLGIS